MRRITKIGLNLMVAVAMLVQCALAAGPVSSVKLNQVQQKNADLTMYVSMSDAAGNPYTGNSDANQYEISVDGKALDVDSAMAFDYSAQGIHYVFSVDVSKSLTDAMMQNVRSALTKFVEGLGAKDTVSIFTFGEVVTEVIKNSASKAAIYDAIDKIDAIEGMTALYKGVIDAVNTAAATGGRSAVIVITDGKNDPTEEMSAYTKDTIYDQVKNAQVPLYCIGLDDKKGVDTQSLIELATATGGDQYVIQANQLSERINKVKDIMRHAVVLHATLINTDGRAGFDGISTFKVGFQPENGPFLTSNELQQNINWKSVPTPSPEPTPSPSPTPIPQLSLSLDGTEVKNVPGGNMTITGAIDVKQGEVKAEDISISVNGEAWKATLSQNGTGFIFKAEGVVSTSTEVLEVQVEIKKSKIASGIQRLAVATPTPALGATPSPRLSLSLNSHSVLYIEGNTAAIGGTVTVDGSVNPEDLAIFVNENQWTIESITEISDGQYEFKAEGIPTDVVGDSLDVRVRLKDTSISSPAQQQPVVTPTPSPSPTPAPQLSIELDNSGRDILFNPGETVTISGVINVQGLINPENLVLHINGVPCDMTTSKLNDNQYEFFATREMNGDISELSIKVELNGTEIFSRAQRLNFVTPSPTPNPELALSLEESSVTYVAGEMVTVSGNIEVLSGEVSAEDLSLYVNSTKWDMETSEISQGSYAFTAENALPDDKITQLDVRVRLQSNTKVSSNSEKIPVILPTPEPTPVPTPRPTVTPPPKAVESTKEVIAETAAETTPTPAPVVTPEPDFMGKILLVVNPMIETGAIWFLGAGLLLLIIIIVLIIVLAVRRKRRTSIVPTEPSSFSVEDRHDDGKAASTVRSEEATVISDQMDMKYSGDTQRLNVKDSVVYPNPGSNTHDPGFAYDSMGGERSGTIRMDWEELNGTVRLDEDEEVGMNIMLDEICNGKPQPSRTLHIRRNDELVFGRSEFANVVLGDTTVSSRHMMVTFDGENAFVEDMHSTNGTKHNGRKLAPEVLEKLSDGDTVFIGKTTLKFHFTKPGV